MCDRRHGMVRFYLPLFLALLILATPVDLLGQDGSLAKMHELSINVSVSALGQSLGVTEDNLNSHVLVLLRSKLPRLSVIDAAPEHMLILVDLGVTKLERGREIGYFGNVYVGAKRWVNLIATNKTLLETVWGRRSIVTGPDDASAGVRRSLDTLITLFAADWYRDNPSK